MVSAGPGDVPKLPEPLWPHLQNGNPAVPGAGVGVRGLERPPRLHLVQHSEAADWAFLGSWPVSLPAPGAVVDDTDSRVPDEGLYCPQLWQRAGTSVSTGIPGPQPPLGALGPAQGGTLHPGSLRG